MPSDKVKRQVRRNADSLTIVKQLTICKFHNSDVTVPLGRFRKHHALNCGRSGCFMCTNPRRRFGHLTLPELKANEAFKYDLKQL